jgi:AcrR family transcriptional regulator
MITSRYRSPLRAAQAAGTRARILDACLAIMRTGAELTYHAVAARADVQERTVYRHFPTRSDLESGVWQWILDQVTHVDFNARNADELIKLLHRSFAGFDADAALIQAMLHSRQGLEVRLRQQPRRRAMFEACVESAAPGLPAEGRARAAAALQVLYSASSWELLRTFWGLDGSQAADVVESAMRALLAALPDGHQAHRTGGSKTR